MRAFLFVWFLLLPWIGGPSGAPAAAHSGGLNAEGCHNNRKTGGYHCHRGASAHPSRARQLTQSSGREFAYETAEIKNGVFTSALLQGLSGAADADKDGRVRVSELRDYVGRRVRELTAGQQNPTMRRENLANDFSIR